MPRHTPSAPPETRPRLTDAASRDALQLIAEGVTKVAGFGVAAISVVRDDETLECVAIAGNEQARAELEGTRTPAARLEREVAIAEDWGLLRFVPHERLQPDRDQDDLGWVPDIEPSADPDAWHPLDLLIAPLYDDEGVLRGSLAMDLPVDGRRPGMRQRDLLNKYAEQAGRAVVVALEREELADQVRMAQAARRIVRQATAQLNLERILAECRDALVEGFRASGMWIQIFSQHGDGPGHLHSVTGEEVVLGPELVAIAEDSARNAWRSQRVLVVPPGGPWLPPVDEAQGAVIEEFLRGIGVASLLFVPLGAGPECVGNLVLTRVAGGPPWTETEATAALDIGHDLGRAILNARTFEREHRLVQELRTLDAYKGRLIATVAHELKNPLSSVLGHLEILESAPDLTDRTRSSLAAMERGAQRMVKVIEDLLLLSKVGDPDNPVIARPVDLSRVLHDVIDLMAVSVGHKGQDLRVELPAEPVFALGDADELDRVCTNLISNAVKYTPEGGAVTLRLERVGREVVLTCADEGIGISAADLERLGTEFFRSSNPLAFSQPGTGLGLAIVRRILDRHGGRLEVSSELGKGSAFTVHLPAAGGT